MHGSCPEPKMTKSNNKILNFDVVVHKPLGIINLFPIYFQKSQNNIHLKNKSYVIV